LMASVRAPAAGPRADLDDAFRVRPRATLRSPAATRPDSPLTAF
jgi:hypothetical protein